MKKLSPKLRRHYISIQRARKYKETIYCNYLKRQKKKKKKKESIPLSESQKTRIERTDLIKNVYRKRYFNKPDFSVDIQQEFGIEDENQIKYFFDVAESLVDFRSKRLHINLKQCSRIWPSGITLLCSLMQWVEVVAHIHKPPKISSSNSNTDKVNSYLTHCGFYDYVNRPHSILNTDYYKDCEIIKIKREVSTSDIEIEEKEDKLIALLKKYTNYDNDQIEYFDSVILTEVFGNVREHGVSKVDRGWWLLAQYHKTHGVISLCIADNGIGIKNSLLTGPQRYEINSNISNASTNDGELIKLALNKNVSGALSASTKIKGLFSNHYERGSRKGNGLNKIRKACRILEIPFAILSHNGYIFVDKNSNIIDCATRNNRIFAGTMYNFNIPVNFEKLRSN